jgi:hypothetical protein
VLRRSLAPLALFAAAACSKPTLQGAGIVATVTVDSAVKADCISVFVTSSSGTSLESTRAMRQGTLQFGIAEGNGLTGSITVVARGYLGTDCMNDAALNLNAQSDPKSVSFKEGVATTPVALEISGALADSDGDGYRAKSDGGTDCDDSNAAINPGAMEQCDDGKDNDCNGQIDCQQTPLCDGTACATGMACAPQGQCMAGGCAPMNNCSTPPAGGCFHGPASCGADGGCAWQVDAGSPCGTGGSCRSDGTCAPQGVETNCSNGLDDDGDGLIDCFDPDCRGYACNDSNACTTGELCLADAGCLGAPVTCTTPPGPCFLDAGMCQAGACVYAAAMGRVCDDNNNCTFSDACADDGGCQGTAISCTAADDGGCFGPTGSCDSITGNCVFPVRTGNSCDDGQSCTANDVCSSAGTCTGTTYSCTSPPLCMGGGACTGDGGCSYSNSPPGTACDGGSCISGACVPSRFPYVPSNFDVNTVPDSGVQGPLVINCNTALFNTNSLSFFTSCGGQASVTGLSITQDSGLPATLVALSGLTVSGTLRVEGTVPVIFQVFGDVYIDGGLDLSTSKSGTPGAGSLTQTNCNVHAGQNGFHDSSSNSVGGGGGGGAFATFGTRGGMAQGGDGGVQFDNALISPLYGGCPGGNGGGAMFTAVGGGGNGGGAIQISASGTVTVDGIITTSGAGGTHGNTDYTGAGGAGSGGAILLEGASVFITANGRIIANGGGGGEGAGVGVTSADGQDGSKVDGTVAMGGGGGSTTGGNGGSGAAGGTQATVPEDGTEGGGGGGGGLGRLRVNGYPVCKLNGSAVVSASSSKNTCN